jgi:hypothetical protein
MKMELHNKIGLVLFVLSIVPPRTGIDAIIGIIGISLFIF